MTQGMHGSHDAYVYFTASSFIALDIQLFTSCHPLLFLMDVIWVSASVHQHWMGSTFCPWVLWFWLVVPKILMHFSVVWQEHQKGSYWLVHYPKQDFLWSVTFLEFLVPLISFSKSFLSLFVLKLIAMVSYLIFILESKMMFYTLVLLREKCKYTAHTAHTECITAIATYWQCCRLMWHQWLDTDV